MIARFPCMMIMMMTLSAMLLNNSKPLKAA